MATAPQTPVDDKPTKQGGRALTVFLGIACLGLGVEVLLLANKTRGLESRLAEAMSYAVPSGLTPGDQIESMTLTDDAGDEVLLSFQAGMPKTLLLAHTNDCTACVETFPIWSDVIPQTSSDLLRVVALRMDKGDTEVSPDPAALPFPVLTVEDSNRFGLDRITRVPMTVLLDSYGVVEKVWAGYLTEEKTESLREFIEEVLSDDQPPGR